MCAAREFNLSSMGQGGRRGQHCNRKASIEWVLLALALALAYQGGGMNTGANHTGLHSITISLCCHGSGALSLVKISHCTKRGLMSQHTGTHMHTHALTHAATGKGSDLFILF